MRDLTFGAYYPTTSFVHKMCAPIKIIISICYIVAIFLITFNKVNGVTTFHFAGFIPAIVFLILAIIFSNVPIEKVIKSLRGIIFFVILSTIIQLIFNKEGTPIFEGWFITYSGLYNAIFVALRIMLVVMGASILTLTTSPVEISDGIEILLTPLKLIKFPVHEFALIMSIALRFIPTLIDETDRIIKAQKARGGNFESGNIFKKAKAFVPVIIPLLISSFRRASELADAMDARCYSGSKNRTKYKKITFTIKDAIGLVLTFGLIYSIILLNNVSFLVVM